MYLSRVVFRHLFFSSVYRDVTRRLDQSAETCPRSFNFSNRIHSPRLWRRLAARVELTSRMAPIVQLYSVLLSAR